MSNSVGELSIALKFDDASLNNSLSSTEKKMGDAAESVKSKWGVATAVVQNVAVQAFNTAVDAATGFAKSVVQAGMDFDATMSQVAAISGATDSELAALTATAQEMGRTTKFTATEAAEGLTYMAMAGWDAQQQMDGLPGIMSLAAAGGADLAETSDIVTDALTAFGQSAAESSRLADIMAAASSNSNTNIHLLGETFKYVAPVAGALNYSMEDTATAIGLMANAGIKGSQAGTALRTLLTNLTKPTDAMSEAMDKLGISITSANGEMKPMSQLTDELREAFSGLSEAEKASYAATIAGKEGMSGLLAIVNAAPADYNKLSEAINNSTGAAQQMADKMLDNLPGQMTLLSSAIDGVKLSIYDGFLPALAEGALGLGDLVGAVSAALSGEGDITSMVDSFVGTFGNALVMGISSLGDVIGKVAPVLIDALVGIIPDLIQGFIMGLTNLAKQVSKVLPDLLKSIVQSIMVIAELLTDPENLQMMLQAGLELLLALVEAIPEVIIAIVDALPQIIDNIITFLTDPATLEMLIRAAVQLFMGLVEAIPRVLGSLIGAVGNLIGSLISHIGSFIPEMIGMAIQLGSEFLNNVISFFQQLPGRIGQFLGEVWTNVSTWVGEMVTKAIEAGQQFLQNIVNFFQQLPGKIWEFLTQTISNVINFVADFIGKAVQAGKDFFDGLVNKVMEIPGKMLEIGGNIVKGIWDGISGAASWLWDQIAGFCSGIVDGIKDFFGIHSPSTLFRDEVGVFMAQGIGVGFSEEMASVNGEMQAVLSENMPSAAVDASMNVNADMNTSFFSTEEQRTAYIEAMTLFYQQLDELQTTTATKLTTNINNWVTQTQNKVQEFTKNVMDKVTQFGTQLAQKASELSKSFHDKLLEYMNKLPDEFNQLGVNIIKGLESGMRAQEPTLMAYVDNLCAKIVAKMQAAMKIHSPSQVMRDQIGVYLAQGVGVGFIEEMEKVNDEMANSITIAEPDAARIDQWIDIDFEDEGTAANRPLTVYMENNIDSDLDIEQVGDQLLEQMRRI